MGLTRRNIFEDVYFYLDLSKDVLKKKDIIKAIKIYIEEKNKFNLKGHYSILIFQNEGNPIFITDKKDHEIITKVINENWQFRSKNISFFENGLFYIFSYISETVRKKSKFNRIIVITDTPSDLNEEYQEALFNLVSKIKIFPTFIDIIRITEGERFFKDDVKLNILASETKGGIFYIDDKKQFINIIRKLIKNKQFIGLLTNKKEEVKISKEDYSFYSKLAKNLIPSEESDQSKCYICNNKVCSVCNDLNDNLESCEDCKVNFHQCCVVNYTIENNIGIPHIFRCPNCDVLLQINETLVVDVLSNNPEVISVEDLIMNNSDNSRGDLEYNLDMPTILDIEDIIFSNQVKNEEIIEKSKEFKTKAVRIGGYFGHAYIAKKVGDKIVYERATKEKLEKINFQNSSNIENEVSKPYKEDINDINEQNKKIKKKLKICPLCGANSDMDKDVFCPKCGKKLI